MSGALSGEGTRIGGRTHLYQQGLSEEMIREEKVWADGTGRARLSKE